MKLSATGQLVIEDSDLPVLLCWHQAAQKERRERYRSNVLKACRILRARGNQSDIELANAAAAEVEGLVEI